MEKKGSFNKMSFSILLANFNSEQYIETAIKSVLSQTYSNWELVIVDDQSTDKSIEKITPFLRDNRIKLIKHNTNQGYSATLKTAIDNAANEIIGILDSDDKLNENALEIMARAYKEYPDSGFIYSTMWDCDSNLKNCILNKDIQEIIPAKSNIFINRISHFKTFTKEAYKKTSGFDPNQKKAVDKDIIYKLEEVTDFKFINTPLYYYRQHTAGISQLRNVESAYLYAYIAKCKAFQRRLNKNIPNVTLKYLFTQYIIITFNNLINFLKFLINLFRIPRLIKFFSRKFPYISRSMKYRYNFVKFAMKLLNKNSD